MKRLLLILLQVVVSAELTLQGIALVLPMLTARAADPAALDRGVTILCVGDSHTFGAPLPEEESYPAQLQEQLDGLATGTFRVVNLGVPGMNSAMMASRFDANLAAYRPDLVILWAGANNAWNENETEAWDRDSSPNRLYRLVLRLKLVRLIRFLGSSVADPQSGRQASRIDFVPGSHASFQLGDEVLEMQTGRHFSRARAGVGARKDLPAMVRLTRAYGIPILLVTYPHEDFEWINGPIREIARDLDVPLLETREALTRALADGHDLDALVVMAAGPHPRRPLYGYVVADMLPHVLKLLEDR